MSYYAQHYSEGESEAVRRQRALADLFKSLEQWQAIIRTKLEIMVRSGKSKASMDDLDNAAAEYGKAFTAIIDSAPEAQKAIGR
jgi:hypothetical protein